MTHARAAAPPPQQTTPRRKRASLVQIAGELLITLGVVALLFVIYEAYWTNLESGRLQGEADAQLGESWQDPNPRGTLTPELGEAFARLYIPAFGPDYHFAILEGTDDATLLSGPGHYPTSQMPGEPGNFAVAGHRVGKGSPFNDLGELTVCDAIVVETATSWETYRVVPMAESADRAADASSCFTPDQAEALTTGAYAQVAGRHITDPWDIDVIDPIPGEPGTVGAVDPNLAGLITLTTCHPQFSNEHRMIIHAMLVDSQPKAGGEDRPVVLTEG